MNDDYPREVQIVLTSWECGYVHPSGRQCLHKTQGLAENCIKNRAGRDEARARRIKQKQEYLAMMSQNKQIVTALIGGASVSSQAEQHGRTNYYVTTIFHECVDDAIRHRIDCIMKGKSYDELNDFKTLRAMRRQVTLTWVRHNRQNVWNLLEDWWPTVLEGNDDE